MTKDILPFVSVIVPAYNDIGGLLQTLSCLDRQNYRDPGFEVVVVDNGSKPALEVPSTYSFPLKLVVETAAGSYAARNKGIELACGDVLVFTDADCEPVPQWIALGVDRLGVPESKTVVGGKVELFSMHNANSWAGCYALYSGFSQRTNIESKGFAATANLFVYRSAFDVVGEFNQSLMSGGDSEWCWRSTAAGYRMVYGADALVRHPCRSSLSSLITQARRVAGGRMQLDHAGWNSRLNGSPGTHIKKQSISGIVSRVLGDKNLSLFAKFKIIAVGAVMRVVTFIEGIRLRSGSYAERR